MNNAPPIPTTSARTVVYETLACGHKRLVMLYGTASEQEAWRAYHRGRPCVVCRKPERKARKDTAFMPEAMKLVRSLKGTRVAALAILMRLYAGNAKAGEIRGLTGALPSTTTGSLDRLRQLNLVRSSRAVYGLTDKGRKVIDGLAKAFAELTADLKQH